MVASEELFREAVIISTEIFPLFQEKQIGGAWRNEKKYTWKLSTCYCTIIMSRVLS